MSRNLIHILYGVPAVSIYTLTVASVLSIRKRFSSTFVAIFLLTAVTNLITYLNTWTTFRLNNEQWFFGYYEFINQTVAISYIHQFLAGFMYFAQNINASLLSLDRFFAIAVTVRWKDMWTQHFGAIAFVCHVLCAVLYFGTGGFYDLRLVNAFVYNPAIQAYQLKMNVTSNLPLSLGTQAGFGIAILTFCTIINVVSFVKLSHTHLSNKTVISLERSFFFISLSTFVTQTLCIFLLVLYFYFLIISQHMDTLRTISAITVFTSDAFSLGPGIYTLIFRGPIRRQFVVMLTPWRKHPKKDGSTAQRGSVLTIQTASSSLNVPKY